ncbi:MAG: hypothetical protein AABW63_02080 [Nanoarchaeota archaeon]
MDFPKELENLYKDVLNSKDENFYLEIKKYLNYAITHKKFSKIKLEIDILHKKDCEDYDLVSNELRKTLLKLKKELEKRDIKDERIKKLMVEFEGYISGKNESTAPLVESLFYNLEEILNILNESYDNKIKDLTKIYFEEKNILENKREVSVWYAFYNLSFVRDCLERDNPSSSLLNKLGMALKKKEINDTIKGNLNIDKKKRGEYEDYMRKTHNFILKEFDKKINLTWNPLMKYVIAPLFVLVVGGLILAFILGSQDSNQTIEGNNNIQVVGNNNIIYNQLNPELRDLALELGLTNFFVLPDGNGGNFSADFYNVKFTNPLGQEIFFKEFAHAETKVYALCNQDRTDCYIFPDYRYDSEKDDECIKISQDSWSKNDFIVSFNPENEECVGRL